MTKEELIKLSRENLRKSKHGSLCECYDEAFIKGYELSEKHIEELEKENAKLKSFIKDLIYENSNRCFKFSNTTCLFNSDYRNRAEELIGERL